MTLELKQGTNQLEVVGILKSKNLEHRVLKYNDGQIADTDAISGNIVIEWKRGAQLQNTRVNIFAPQYSRKGNEMASYKSVLALESEFKDKDTFGTDADRISARGDVSWNPYFSRDGQLRESNRLSGQFFSRLDLDDTSVSDHAVAQLSLTITGFTPILKDNVIVNYAVNAFNVGYNESINPIKGLQLSATEIGDNMEEFKDTFEPGSTANFDVLFNNYAEVETTSAESHGFGKREQMGIAKSYVRNAEIIFTDGVIFDPEGVNGLTPDQIKHAKDLKDQKLEALKPQGNGNPISHSSSTTRSFGKAENTQPADQNSDVPNFNF